MRRPVKTRKDLDIASNHFLRRNPGYPLGITLAELDYLRGWKDEFLGDQLADQYTSNTVGATILLRDAVHGGEVRLRTAAGSGNHAELWLGDNAGGYDTLDADEGWIQISRQWHVSNSNVTSIFGASDPGLTNDRIWVGGMAGTWRIRCSSGGATTTIDTGIAVETTDWHWHVIKVFPVGAGRRIDYYIDGNLVATCTTDVPNIPITPLCYLSSTDDGDAKVMHVDYWAVIPRNL